MLRLSGRFSVAQPSNVFKPSNLHHSPTPSNVSLQNVRSSVLCLRRTSPSFPIFSRSFSGRTAPPPSPHQALHHKNSPPLQKAPSQQEQPPSPANIEQQPEEAQVLETVVEVGYGNFEEAVLKSPIPVILDCYADWCEPCKQLTPKLLQAVKEANGALRIALLNTDQFPEIAKQLRIENLPTVIGWHRAKAVDAFTGIPTDKRIKDFVDSLLKKGGIISAAKFMEMGEELLKENDIDGAAKLFVELVQQKNLKSEALGLAGLARCALAEKNLEIAESLVNQIKEKHPKDLAHAEVKKALAAVQLAQQGAPAGAEQQALIDKVQQNPSDLQGKYDLAVSYFQSNKHSLAMDQCFDIIKKEKQWNDQAARKLLLQIFDALGPKDPIVKEGRKRLSNLWFL